MISEKQYEVAQRFIELHQDGNKLSDETIRATYLVAVKTIKSYLEQSSDSPVSEKKPTTAKSSTGNAI